jgi:predicted PurR-regulated permease PerM/ribosomal protein S18 acetylase RimI-like enzyme
MDTSPRWSTSSKFIVMLAILAVFGFLLIRFQVLIAPVIMAVILAYLLNPIVNALRKYLRLPRTIAVVILYLVLILLLVGLISGVTLLLQQQFSGVLATALTFINSIPDWINSLTAKPVTVGPFTFDLSTADVTLLQNTLLPSARDAIGRVTEWMTGAASGIASFLGWTLFVLTVSFYLILDLDAVQKNLLRMVPEDYKRDVRRLLDGLGPLWNAFLRGQLMLSLIMGTVVGLMMSLLGVRYAVILGLIAGLMEFIPILGWYIAIGTEILVALFQPANWIGLTPVTFAIVVAVAALGLQQLEASFLIPRIMQSQLKVHPAAQMVGVLIGASLLGVSGLLLSAPILATGVLFGRYVHAKLFNLPPWPDLEEQRSFSVQAPSVRIRPARESDTEEMHALTTYMWEGHDYIREVWPKWLADRDGFLAAAEADGRIVGFGKLTRLAPQEWWLEGLRVHPEYQGMKIASQLTEHLLEKWKQSDGGVIRLAVSSERPQVHHLCDRLGFRRVESCRLTAAPPLERGDCEFQPMAEADAGDAFTLWEERAAAWGTTGMVNIDWRWSTLTKDRLQDFIRKNHAWWWRERSGILLAYDSNHDHQPSLEVAAILAPLQKLTMMLRPLRVLAEGRKAHRVAWVLPDKPRVFDAAKRAGFVPSSDAQLWLFERSDLPIQPFS